MLAQMFSNVNTKIQEPAIRPEIQPVENKVISRRYTGDASSLQIARQVIAGTMDEAVSVLGGVGVKLLIPGTDFASCESIAAYFGVTDRYIRLLAMRTGVIAKKLPNDVEYAEGESFLKRHGIGDCFVKDGVFYKSKEGNSTVREACEAYYSARAILILVCAMEHARPFNRTAMNQNVGSVFTKAANSVYGERAKEENMMNNNQTPGKSTAILTSEGNLVLTLDFFSAVIKTAVREAISEAAPERADSGEEMQKPVFDDRLPGIVAAQESRAITGAQAAKLLGVSQPKYFRMKKNMKQEDYR